MFGCSDLNFWNQQSCKCYLRAHPGFLLNTDHNHLVGILKKDIRVTSEKLQPLLEACSWYNFKLEYITMKKNKVADLLLRPPLWGNFPCTGQMWVSLCLWGITTEDERGFQNVRDTWCIQVKSLLQRGSKSQVRWCHYYHLLTFIIIYYHLHLYSPYLNFLFWKFLFVLSPFLPSFPCSSSPCNGPPPLLDGNAHSGFVWNLTNAIFGFWSEFVFLTFTFKTRWISHFMW